MNNMTIVATPSPKILEQLLISGDLSALSATERVEYYLKTCESLGLNPMTKPFAYIKLNGKLQLYALRDCTEQLRKIHGVSVFNLRTQLFDDETYIVTADFRDSTGRLDTATGAVSLKGLSGEARTNKMMGCETKAKRRGTLSICGMGMLDETEVDTIPGAEKEAAEKFPRLRPAAVEKLADAATAEHEVASDLVDQAVQLALEASVPQPDPEPEEPAEPERLREYYGKLRRITIGEKDFNSVNAWIHQCMNSKWGLRSLRDTTDEQLENVLRWLETVARTRRSP